MSNYKFKTTNIKGKEYVEVNERIKYFRMSGDYKGWSLSTEVIHFDENGCVIKATIANAEGYIVATGFAQEDKASSYINKTSYVENCETSAWGRALANLGIGIDTSIASSNEVSMAIAKQGNKSNAKATKTTEKLKLTSDIKSKMLEAVKNGQADKVEAALNKYDISAAVRKEILG